ncbi:MAG: OadG-related small transporter subunit [Clostridiaceae bacterium]|nr:OadG-related small transporter subunit [Clostridiaceae bacterium]
MHWLNRVSINNNEVGNNMDVFFESIKVMGLGMLGIFIVISVFYAMIVLLGKVFPAKGNNL